MILLRTEMKPLRIILALACGFTTSTHAVAQAKAAPRAAATVFRDCRACPEMVVLPAGSFTMGSSAEEESWAASHGDSMKAVADEAPQHQVSSPPFALGKCADRGQSCTMVLRWRGQSAQSTNVQD
jgi:formylglycine-generating enzyme required for sulfatase activity